MSASERADLLAAILQRALLCAASPRGLRQRDAQTLLRQLEVEFFPNAAVERRREHDEILKGIREELSR